MTKMQASSMKAIFKDAMVTDYNGLMMTGVLMLCVSEYATRGASFMFGLFMVGLILDVIVMSDIVWKNVHKLDDTIKGTFGKRGADQDRALVEWQVRNDFIRDLEKAREYDKQTEEGIERRCMVLPFVLAVILYCAVNGYLFM